ncbi:type VII secretion protein EssA [Sporosarcina sp. Marseille-Q4063]|uniref:type VII secretion protein EssA n=1 Tax=Sporosarcina sp. Marseille-Q4063 TaxID=2810514 RepID=UPI001BB07A86|nr:type VII secretion protein EssA [Sporosarcina sp. Marseille-Q4063]QUW20791.1 type VII secretion protein EssA [Sporosarcina sp. Marseille-Q4063]
MKGLLKHCSIVIALSIAFLTMLSYQVSADDPSSPSGKLQLKTDRIGQDRKTKPQVDKKTELENSFPDLFKEETQAVIEAKQKELRQENEDLKQMLFKTENEKDITIEETMKTLFTSDYTAPKASVANDDTNEGDGGIMGNTLFSSLIGMVVLLCGGIFAVMRKMVE